MKVEEASNGEEALRSVAAGPPDLIFMDVRLPGESGLDVTRRIKTDYSRIPVIILTNHDSVEYREAAYQHGADHFLPKASSTWDEIAALVESILPDAWRHAHDLQ